MIIKQCSDCKVNPSIQTEELGIIYRLICGNCGKHTQDIICPTSTINNPHIDDETKCRLVQEWNEKN